MNNSTGELIKLAKNLSPVFASTLFFMSIKPLALSYLNQSKLGQTKKEKEALADRAVGFIHAVVSTSLSAYFLATGGPQTTMCTPLGPGFKTLAMLVSGFFVNDIIVSFHWGWSYVLHGVMSFCAYIIPALTDYAHRYAAGFLLFEVSTIPFHISALVLAQKKATGEIYSVGGSTHPLVFRWQLIFALTFILVRIGFGFWWSARFQFQAYNEPHPECFSFGQNIIQLMNVAFNILNAFWSIKIVKRGLRGHSNSSKDA
mmetsp:Transcript_23978/g.32987  ORF Transcript_23978/g.32987 Transcript_23978/m.32987 type:complete len:258 (-) Transcript_23978:273-1046(-)|eukprot:CAMPEP_0196582888 /NCGR_PEP_ID=MMETSP1081-20130531/41193_1 /TAXON_ID=36882 /ORGANISM="Pyramimonas amylifera, Strain CCMP720" /LENGTH=257 /DNA_ID=CAMNT_0041903609 /DNA_START=83 /DNA_END=856 /DNA_ORIENTATION=-